MAYATVFFKHPQSGRMREAPVGFSWTTLFFGPLPALFRADWLGFIIILICALVTFGVSNLVFMFIYNRWHLRTLVNEGYLATGAKGGDLAFIEGKTSLSIPRAAP